MVQAEGGALSPRRPPPLWIPAFAGMTESRGREMGHYWCHFGSTCNNDNIHIELSGTERI